MLSSTQQATKIPTTQAISLNQRHSNTLSEESRRKTMEGNFLCKVKCIGSIRSANGYSVNEKLVGKTCFLESPKWL
jgi:hypothetical protein